MGPAVIAVAAIVAALYFINRDEAQAHSRPAVQDILEADLPKLDYYYEVINEAFYEGFLSAEDYWVLYEAYETRWQELMGA